MTTTSKHSSRVIMAVGIAAVTLGAASPALANIAHYDVRVDGLACPFCAYGLEKKLRKLPGVTNLQIDLDQGRASFDVAFGTVLMPPPIQEAVRAAGFTSRELRVRALGTVQGDDGKLSLAIGGGQTLHLRSGAALDPLQALVREGHRELEVTGVITRSGDTWQLEVAAVRRRGDA